MNVSWLPRNENIFPHPNLADKHGVLAVGGDLSSTRLITAYLFGIFPWFSEQEPIIWWSTNPRMVLIPKKVKVSKSMRAFISKNKYRVSYNQQFEAVIDQCATVKRVDQDGTWINQLMLKAYKQLHLEGKAISIEVWEGEELIGGLYGLALGKIFFGESMFSMKSNASKFGLILLAKKLETLGFLLIDCQQDTPHMRSMGAELMERKEFLTQLRENRKIYLESESKVFF